jgi:hypothetical protein
MRCTRAHFPRTGAGAEQGEDQVLLGLVVEGHEAQQGQVTPGGVVAVEEGELLLPMRRVVGGIDVDGDPSGTALEAGTVLPDDHVGQRVAQPGQGQGADSILEARQRRLRGQGGPGQRIPIEQEMRGRLRTLFRRLRAAFPGARLRVRLDGGFAGDDVLSFLEAEGVEYVVALGGNRRLEKRARRLMGRARMQARATGETGRNRICAIQSVAIEPPSCCVRTCFDTTVLAHLMDSVALLFHPA